MCKFDTTSKVGAILSSRKSKIIAIFLICLLIFSRFAYPEQLAMGNWLTSAPRIVNMSGSAAEFVKQAIAKDKIVIFSKTYCPYCTMAKEVSQQSFNE